MKENVKMRNPWSRRAVVRRLRVGALMAAALSAAMASADVFTLSQVPNSLAEWKNQSFYVSGAAPSGTSSDVIEIPRGMMVTVTDRQTDVVSFLSAVGNIRVLGSTDASQSQGKLVLDVSEGATVEFTGCIRDDSSGSTYAKVEKVGKGVLKLKNVDAQAYCSSWDVAEGELWLPPPDVASVYTHVKSYGLVWVAPGAVLRTDLSAETFTSETNGKSNSCHVRFQGLFNDGEVRNESDTKTIIKVYHAKILPPQDACEGSFLGKLRIFASGGSFKLHGIANNFTDYIELIGDEANYPAELSVRTFGAKGGGVSSLGANDKAVSISGALGGCLTYAGTGETSDKDLMFIAGTKTTVAPSEISGGEHGGLTLTGAFSYWTSSVGWIPHIVFSGNHRNPCTFAGTLADFTTKVFDGTTSMTYPRYLKKTGTGEWYFPANPKLTTGATIEVADGTLAFDSIAGRGYDCSLGRATACFGWEAVQPLEANRVSYAYALGSASGTEAGMMECRGAEAQLCTDRPFALKGRGGFRANTCGLLRFADVYGLGSGAKALLLDGSSVLENEVHDIRDGEGVVSVEKSGSGTWVMGGDLTFSGSLSVLGGKLIVRRPSKAFRQYRLMIKEIVDNNRELLQKRGDENVESTGRTVLSLVEIGLWAADGSRQNMNLAYRANVAALKAGEFAIGGERTFNPDHGKPELSALIFDGCRYTSADSKFGEVWQPLTASFAINGVNQQAPRLDSPGSWIPVDMYLPEGAKPIDHFDVMSGVENNSRLAPSAFQLLASVDGIHWEEVSATESLQDAAKIKYVWMSDGTPGSLVDGGLPPYNPASADFDRAAGWKTTRQASEREFAQLTNVGTVSVANGATLAFEGESPPSLHALRLDAAKGGVIDGFSLAEDGTLIVMGDIPNTGNFALPVDFVNVVGLKNLNRWNLSIEGTHPRHRRISVMGGRVMICDPGFAIVIR